MAMEIIMSIELTRVQRRILDYITDQKTGKGVTPTLAEIADKFKYRSRSTVQQHLDALVRKGFIKRKPRLSRAIELTAEDSLFTTRAVIGETAAGDPLTIYPDAIDTVELPKAARLPKDSFLLRVKGDSLKDAYIFSGDIVIVNPNIDPKNGQIVVAVLDNAAVIKKYFKRKNEVELVSENPEYKSIIIDKNYLSFKIVGIVIGVYRSMEKRF
jgi:repressor LexA